MNRTIKFRGKEIKTGQWVYGLYTQGSFIDPVNNTETVRHIIHSDMLYDVSENTVGQFTGLLDKNGKEIYEGDIVKNKEIGSYGCEYIGVVKYYESDCKFGIDITATYRFTKRLLFTEGECSFNDGHCTITYTNEYYVIGNIYDNPELLKSL